MEGLIWKSAGGVCGGVVPAGCDFWCHSIRNGGSRGRDGSVDGWKSGRKTYLLKMRQ